MFVRNFQFWVPTSTCLVLKCLWVKTVKTVKTLTITRVSENETSGTWIFITQTSDYNRYCSIAKFVNLVCGLEHVVFFCILAIKIPADFHLFRWRKTTKQSLGAGLDLSKSDGMHDPRTLSHGILCGALASFEGIWRDDPLQFLQILHASYSYHTSNFKYIPCFLYITVSHDDQTKTFDLPVALGDPREFLGTRAEVRITETCTDARTNSLPADTPTFRFREANGGNLCFGWTAVENGPRYGWLSGLKRIWRCFFDTVDALWPDSLKKW